MQGSERLTQLQAFIKYLGEGDLEMLDLILSDDITYFGATKAVFLHRLDDIFNQVQKIGLWHQLRVVRHTKRRNIYYLCFWKENTSQLKMIINSREGIITEMFNNTRIEKEGDEISIDFYDLFFAEDERAGFKPGTEYVMTHYQCREAYDAFFTPRPVVLDYNSLCNWLSEQEELYKLSCKQYYYFGFRRFRSLYFNLEFVAGLLQYRPYYVKALNEFDFSSPKTILNWLFEWRRLIYCHVLGADDDIHNVDWSRERVRIFRDPDIYYQGTDYSELLQFSTLYRWFENQFRDELMASIVYS